MLPQDAELEQALVRALSPASRYQRFFAPIRELPEGWLQRLTQIDYRRQQAFIVETFAGDQALAVAEARYVVDASGEECEFAVVVADDWQHLGLARRLMQLLMQSAAEAGLKRMVGDVLATNRAMLSLAQSQGFKRHAPPRRRRPGAARAAGLAAGRRARRRAYCTGPFSAAGIGKDIISMPSSSSAWRSSARGLAADAARFDLAVVDAPRLLGEALADVVGVRQHVPHGGHPLRLQRLRGRRGRRGERAPARAGPTGSGAARWAGG